MFAMSRHPPGRGPHWTFGRSSHEEPGVGCLLEGPPISPKMNIVRHAEDAHFDPVPRAGEQAALARLFQSLGNLDACLSARPSGRRPG